jgi:hypothetical protein
VSQISPPIRILVIAVLGLLAAYMLLLRPKDEVVPASPTPAGNVATGKPAVSGAGKIAEKAKAAVDASNAKSQETAETAGSEGAAATPAAKPATKAAPAAKPAPVAATKDGVSLAGLPKSVAKPLAKDKVLVLLFWNNKSADDRAVRSQLRKVSRWDGMVAVRAASIKDVSRYGRITRGADVSQSPTTLVVDRNLKATPLVGYFDTKSIDQAAFDALRNSGGYLKAAYLEKVNETCAAIGNDARFVARPNSFGELGTWASSGKRVASRMNTRFAAIKAPERFRGFKRATVADHKFLVSYYADWAAFLGKRPTASRFMAGVAKFSGRERQYKAVAKKYNKRMDDRNLVSCGASA